MDGIATQSLGRSRLRRIAGMSLAEIGHRSRQEGSKWLDRLRPTATSAVIDPAAAVTTAHRTFERRFFPGVTAHTLGVLSSRREYVDGITADANALLEGRFDLLAYRGLAFGDPIDWHWDPVWNRRAPLAHWSQIDALDPSVVGDSKIIWELNRHQWAVRLAQATVLTGDPRYATHALSLIADWIERNPVGRGINWASSLEVALRLMSWSWVIALLRNTDVMTDVMLTTMLASLNAHASHVCRYLSNYYSPNTHLTGEALGLFYAGTLFPQFADAAKWQACGGETLIAQAERQVSTDGVYFEQSSCYQRYTCDIYLQFLLLANRAGYEVPADTRNRVERLTEFLAAICTPSGSMPDFGDADGGWLMPLTRRDANDCRGTLAVASVVFNRPDLAVDVDAVEPLWLAGSSADAVASTPRSSLLFPQGGYALLRSTDHELIMDVGPLGCYAHGHADLLAIQCSVFGERILVDAGTGGYTPEPEWRDYFRSSRAHNTITVDGRGQAEPTGPFGWQSRPAARICNWQTGVDFDVIEAEHHAYDAITHRRRAVLVKPSGFVIVDELLGEGEHTFELRFQFAPMAVELVDGLAACATTPSGRRVWLMPQSSVPLQATIINGGTDPIGGWVSSEYGERHAAPMLVYSARAHFPARIVTVLHSSLD